MTSAWGHFLRSEWPVGFEGVIARLGWVGLGWGVRVREPRRGAAEAHHLHQQLTLVSARR